MDIYLLDHGFDLLGGEFVGDGPARGAADEAEPFLIIEAVDLIDHTIDVIGQGGTLAGDFIVERQNLVRAPAQLRQGIGLEPPIAEPVEKRQMGSAHVAANDFTIGIGEELKATFSRHGGVELAHRARGRVAGIGERGLTGFLAAGIEGLELGLGHIDLATHFQYLGGVGRQGLGDVPDGLKIEGEILALAAVAPGCALDEMLVLVAHRNRQPVDLRLSHQVQRRILVEVQHATDAGKEPVHGVRVERVIERQHGDGMTDLGETR